MPHKISAKQALREHGVTLEDCVMDCICPACCSELCEVEPDGECEHGFPSVLIQLGMI